MKFFVLFVLVMLSGCTQVQARRLGNGIERVKTVVENVCMATPLFDAVDAATPVADACKRIVETFGHDEYVVIVEALQCVEHTPTRSAEMAQCIDDIDGWKNVAEKMVK